MGKWATGVREEVWRSGGVEERERINKRKLAVELEVGWVDWQRFREGFICCLAAL